ncbi:Uncharacterized protein PECH_003650 [Penicillium ucsense]|uniref:magnesium chelatase n=1 Tax=Penicillium ucsense TaxID=2839758 RepID=A0A8J8W5G5_9EURO|nr:Uncharacterized protein PECM_001850 [Penicillium ucsense]KAF7737475.1 Uncharacterized protein PECH_003650 [Penicillium ucsense]
MDFSSFEKLARQLSDLEVAVFLSLVAREHCLIETSDDLIDDLAQELALVCTHSLGLAYSILDCSAETSTNDLCNGSLTPSARKEQEEPAISRLKSESSGNLSTLGTAQSRDQSRHAAPRSPEEGINVVNVVIAKNFNLVDHDVQLQALQLMRSRHLFMESYTLNAPANFIFIPLVVRESEQLQPPLNCYLNEHLLVSHYHAAVDGFSYLEQDDWLSDDRDSASSVIYKPIHHQQKSTKISETTIEKLREASDCVTISAEIMRYMQDIIVFLRLSRGMGGGIYAKANLHLSRFSRLLAALQGFDFITPTIVALAAEKVLRHRIIVATPDRDRSMQYGSDVQTVSRILADITPDSILDGVFQEVEPPV